MEDNEVEFVQLRRISQKTKVIKNDKAEDEVYSFACRCSRGEGWFGKVYPGYHHKSLQPVALKVFKKTKHLMKDKKRLSEEVDAFKKLDHPGIVRVYNCFEGSNKYYMITEKMEIDLIGFILQTPEKKLDECKAQFFMKQILVAVQYLNSNHITHGDLRAENVLLSSKSGYPCAKISDYGYSRIIRKDYFMDSLNASPSYSSPEILAGKQLSKFSDIWSCGVIMYITLCGMFPFASDGGKKIRKEIMKESIEYPEELFRCVSAEALHLLKQMLTKEAERCSIESSIRHDWFTKSFHLWRNCKSLEAKLGKRFLTVPSEDKLWELQSAANGEEKYQTQDVKVA